MVTMSDIEQFHNTRLRNFSRRLGASSMDDGDFFRFCVDQINIIFKKIGKGIELAYTLLASVVASFPVPDVSESCKDFD